MIITPWGLLQWDRRKEWISLKQTQPEVIYINQKKKKKGFKVLGTVCLAARWLQDVHMLWYTEMLAIIPESFLNCISC